MDYNDWMKYLANSIAKYKAKREGKLRFMDGKKTNHLCLCEAEFCPYCDCYARPFRSKTYGDGQRRRPISPLIKRAGADRARSRSTEGIK